MNSERIVHRIMLVCVLGLPWVSLQPSLRAQEMYTTVRTKNLDLHHMQGVNPADAKKAGDYLQREYDSVMVQLGLVPGNKIDVRIYDSVGKFLAEAGLKKPWRGAYFSKGVLHCQPVQALLQREIFEKSLTYEITRAILSAVREKGCPMWFTESYAAYRVGEFRTVSAPIGAKLSAFSDLNQDIQQHPDPPQRDDVQYVLGQTFNFLVLQYGEAKALSLFREFDGMTSIDSIFRKVLGEPYDTVEKSWSKYIAVHTSPFKK